MATFRARLRREPPRPPRRARDHDANRRAHRAAPATTTRTAAPTAPCPRPRREPPRPPRRARDHDANRRAHAWSRVESLRVADDDHAPCVTPMMEVIEGAHGV